MPLRVRSRLTGRLFAPLGLATSTRARSAGVAALPGLLASRLSRVPRLADGARRGIELPVSELECVEGEGLLQGDGNGAPDPCGNDRAVLRADCSESINEMLQPGLRVLCRATHAVEAEYYELLGGKTAEASHVRGGLLLLPLFAQRASNVRAVGVGAPSV